MDYFALSLQRNRWVAEICTRILKSRFKYFSLSTIRRARASLSSEAIWGGRMGLKKLRSLVLPFHQLLTWTESLTRNFEPLFYLLSLHLAGGDSAS